MGKSKYPNKKFVNASGDPKKTWLLINQLRGKQRRTISAIDKKDYLYSNWKSTCTKKDQNGDRSIHKIFSDNSRILKHIISDEKSKYPNKKFVNASGDPKKNGY